MSEAVRHLEQEYDTEVRFRAVVVSSERITPESSSEEVRELVLEVERPDFPYRVGQSIGVLAPGNPAFGQAYHFRLYSVADLPERAPSGHPRIKICVRRCSYIDAYSGEEYPGVRLELPLRSRPGRCDHGDRALRSPVRRPRRDGREADPDRVRSSALPCPNC